MMNVGARSSFSSYVGLMAALEKGRHAVSLGSIQAFGQLTYGATQLGRTK
jgi:hypothetical protein